MAKVNIVFDASQYDMFRLCEARFNYRYNMNLSLPTKAAALDSGTLIHLAAETYYQCIKDKANYDFAVNAAMMKLKSASVTESDLGNDEVNHIIDTMEQYFDYWRVADQSFEIIDVEKWFLYPLHEDDDMRILMAGKIDLIISDNQYTNLPYDHKSYSRSGPVGRMGNQFPNYCTALQSNYIIVNRIGLQKSLKPHEKFKRVPLSYDPIRLAQWKQNVTNVIKDQYLNCIATNTWPMNETSCDKYNRQCEYYDVCDSSGQEAKDWKLMSNYIKIAPWDVSKVTKKTSETVEDLNSDKKKEEENGNQEAHSQTET